MTGGFFATELLWKPVITPGITVYLCVCFPVFFFFPYSGALSKVEFLATYSAFVVF